MTTLRHAFLLALLFLLPACDSRDALSKKLERGMTRGAVIAILGEPDYEELKEETSEMLIDGIRWNSSTKVLVYGDWRVQLFDAKRKVGSGFVTAFYKRDD